MNHFFIDTEAQKELDHLNNELLMRIEKGYGDGVLLVSFSLIYFATVIGVLIKFVEYAQVGLKDICVFSVLSAVFFQFPIFIYYTTATHSRENFSALFNIATYKKKFYENFTVDSAIRKGGKWENFHKVTISDFFNKEKNEAFFLSLLSLALYVGSFLLTFYYTFKYFNQFKQETAVFEYILLITINYFYAICLIPAIKRIVKLYDLFAMNDIIGEIESVNTYYDVLKTLVTIATNTTELKKMVEHLKDVNEKFYSFLKAAHISLYEAIELEKLFYSYAFPRISDIAPCNELIKNNKTIHYVKELAEKHRVNLYNYIYDYYKF